MDVYDLLCDFVEGHDGDEELRGIEAHDLATLASHAYWAACRSGIECHNNGVAIHTRSALEAALYAGRCKADAAAARLWRERHAEFESYVRKQHRAGRPIDYSKPGEMDAEARKAMRKAFTIDSCIKATLSLHKAFEDSSVRAAFEKRLRHHYDASIDLGAHPNIMLAKLAEPEERYRSSPAAPAALQLKMVFDDSERLSATLLEIAELGTTLALIVGVVFPGRVKPIRAEDRLDRTSERICRLRALPSQSRIHRHPALM